MRKSTFAIVLLVAVGAVATWYGHPARLQALWTGITAGGQEQAPPTLQHEASGSGQQNRGNRGPAPVEVADARQVRLSDDITAIGSLLSEASVDIAPETSGRIVEIRFRDGAAVDQGAVLFRLDGELIAAQVADAEAKLRLAEATYARYEALRKTRTVAQSVYDQSVTELALARSALNLAKVQLDKLTIRAPFAGTLGFSTVSLGAYVSAGTPLVHLEKIDRLKVSISVPELEFSRLAIGQSVTVTADAVPGESFTAGIVAIDPLVDMNGRALKILAELDNSAFKLRPGMLIRATVQGQSREAVTVPEAAIVPRGSETVVFVASDNKALEAKVRTGKRSGGTVEIVEGLDPGAKVVTAGNTRLTHGMAIQIVSPQAAN